ncbi:RelA/SpoT family protein [Alphaproteobacteria bacterium]|nr:RelA/SpoT family protein [Alphaproteobacteria bacterium]
MLENSLDFAKKPEKYFIQLNRNIHLNNIKCDIGLLKKAYYFSFDRHLNQVRASGEPFASHPYAVANILINLKLDYQSIITALLHDTIEDGVATNDEIKKYFGLEINELVEGVTKLSKIQLPNTALREASNFSKFILAICKDIRILIIKLADRLHNMRTLNFIKEESRKYKIAKETLEVYAPLAGRVGFQIMREELEELAFKVINKQAFQSINKRILFLRKQNSDFISRNILDLKKIINPKYTNEITGREKKAYSTWKKMLKKSIALEKVSDIYAFRIITNTKSDCYKVLGIIHTKWPMIPDRFKDFISTPKPNGYQSIHTTVIGKDGIKMELQIKTKKMHQLAEYGVASHWIYKDEINEKKVKEINKGTKWFQDVLDIIKSADDPKELIEYSRMNMYTDNVFCFTPKGDVISLPKGATALDFAYAVHTNIGNNTIGSKINGKLAPLDNSIKNGDQIEIIRSNGKHPQKSWLNFCKTGKAKSQIKRFLRDYEEIEFEKLGKEILTKILLDINKKATKKSLKILIDGFNYDSYRSFYIAIGKAQISSDSILELLQYGNKQKTFAIKSKKRNLPILGVTNKMPIKLAECCTPLLGENIVGILVEGKGIYVHLLNCSTLERFSDYPELWYELTWDNKNIGNLSQLSKISIILQNKVGSLHRVTSCIKKANINIVDLNISKRSQDFFNIDINLKVNDLKHLDQLMLSLKLEENIYKIKRC